jgi:hypothetical protein
MIGRMVFVVLALLLCCGICQAKEDRWNNFAEDNDLRYYLDQKSVLSLPDNVYLFWVKSVAKDKEYYRAEYNLNNLSYIFTNYELDCAVSSYRIRGTIMFDKNRREINKSLPMSADNLFEPVPPESMLELAQGEVCKQEESATGKLQPEDEEEPAASPPAPASPLTRAAPLSLALPAASVDPAAPVAPLEATAQVTPVEATAPVVPLEETAPAASVGPTASTAPVEPAAPAQLDGQVAPDQPGTPGETPSLQ